MRAGKWYANLTKKLPFGSGVHMSLSREGLDGIGMDRIACAEGVLNNSLTKLCFQQ